MARTVFITPDRDSIWCTGIGVPVINNLIVALGGGLKTTVKGVDKDFNGDGYADLVLENRHTVGVAIWLLKNGVYLPASVCQLFRPIGTSRESETFSATANRTLFGRIWLPASTLSGSSTTAFFNTVSSFQPSQPGWHIVGAGDFNGDGLRGPGLGEFHHRRTGYLAACQWSLLLEHQSANCFAHLAHRRSRRLSRQRPIRPCFGEYGQQPSRYLDPQQRRSPIRDRASSRSAGWHIAGAADFNGDGQADLVLENILNGQRVIWLLKNGVYSSSVALPTLSTQWDIVDH